MEPRAEVPANITAEVWVPIKDRAESQRADFPCAEGDHAVYGVSPGSFTVTVTTTG